ncbi:MAG: histidine kinase [Lutibacter sp.]|nr:histidine kinase [Lutibacter sp.]
MFKKNISILILILGISYTIINCKKSSANDNFIKIISQINNSSNTNLSDSLRNQLLIDAYSKIKNVNSDSLKVNLLVEIAYSNYLLGNVDIFKEISQESLLLALNQNIKLYQAISQSNLGYYYRIKFKNDSSFYYYNQALKNYKFLKNSIEEGKMRYNLAAIQSDEKDYMGSEINTVKAISILKKEEEYYPLFLCYNNLAFIANQLEEYEKSIEYRKEGLIYLSKLNNVGNLELISKNGIGITYQNRGDYVKSIEYLKNALATKDIQSLYPDIYAVLIDNLAYSKFKNEDDSDLPDLFYKSLKIRDSLQIIDGIISSNLHLTEYFLSKGDSLIALQYCITAKDLAKSSNNNIDLLQSYQLLSKLESAEEAKEYLLKHIQLTDSLQQRERVIREKFTRIAYETDEITQEKEAETKKKWWVILFSGIGTSFGILLFINMKQNSKNKELLFNQKQEESNIEIYNLMLSQQEMFQKGSENEKKRISEELHDGILGRLFGTRLSLDSLNEGKTKADIKEREEYIEELQLIEEDVRTIAHNLKASIFNSETNFMKLVEQLVAKQGKIGKFECEPNFNNLTNWEGISNSIKINCYRILQESIQNINKYASASKVQIDFKKVDNNILMSIHDNGVGFNTKKKNKGIGLKNMRSRAEAINSKIEFNSSKGSGTQITMTIPI